MALFSGFFNCFGSAVAVHPPNSGYPSAEADFELQFLVAVATQIKTESQSDF